jgi:hypothetical protein
MIKFFRKIRRQLLSQNRFTKYLLYAIGEIVLVVIGILIALSVNNWKEKKTLKKEEIKLLVGLDEALKIDIKDLSVNDSITKKTLKSHVIIKKQLTSNRPYHDSLAVHFGRCFDVTNFISNPSNLKTSGIDKISNETLKSKILKYYDFDIPHLMNIEKEGVNQHFNLRVVPILMEKFNYSWLYNPASPKNYDELTNDSNFLTLLNITQAITEYKQYLSTIVFESAEELRTEIKKEVDKYN